MSDVKTLKMNTHKGLQEENLGNELTKGKMGELSETSTHHLIFITSHLRIKYVENGIE